MGTRLSSWGHLLGDLRGHLGTPPRGHLFGDLGVRIRTPWGHICPVGDTSLRTSASSWGYLGTLYPFGDISVQVRTPWGHICPAGDTALGTPVSTWGHLLRDQVETPPWGHLLGDLRAHLGTPPWGPQRPQRDTLGTLLSGWGHLLQDPSIHVGPPPWGHLLGSPCAPKGTTPEKRSECPRGPQHPRRATSMGVTPKSPWPRPHPDTR